MHNVYFFTDIHGFKPLYDAIIEYCFTEDDSPTIIFGGDACDRGPDGYKIMKELLSNPQVIYLKGNHEDMFVHAALEIKSRFKFDDLTIENVRLALRRTVFFDEKYYDIRLAIHNGALNTLTDWVMDGMPIDFVEKIDHLPYTFTYEQYDFCHAGGIYQVFKRVNECEYKGESIDKHDAESLIWNRSAFNYGWAPERTVIHGHTPTPYLLTYCFKKPCLTIAPYRYKGNFDPYYTGGKIDMDTGVAITHKIFVLNILTGKAQGFILEKNNQVRQNEIIKV